jgi:hypothetical protein
VNPRLATGAINNCKAGETKSLGNRRAAFVNAFISITGKLHFIFRQAIEDYKRWGYGIAVVVLK